MHIQLDRGWASTEFSQYISEVPSQIPVRSSKIVYEQHVKITGDLQLVAKFGC